MSRWLGGLAFLLLSTSPSAAQQGAYRFEIAGVGDSTVEFVLGDVTWLKPGMYAIAVRPAGHDELLARLSIRSVGAKTAMAIVTGQATSIGKDDVVLVLPPKKHWYQQTAVWISALIGLGVGIVVAR